MNVEMYLAALVLGLVGLYFVVPRLAGTYLRFSGTRVITCPETRKPAAVEVDARHAAVTALFDGPDLRLKDCTRWPERRNCGQECLLQVEISPEDCLVRNMLADWYRARTCVMCHLKFGEIGWSDHKPAVLSPEGHVVQWHAIKPEKLPEVLKTHQPVCWACSITRSVFESHPEIVVDRSLISTPVSRSG